MGLGEAVDICPELALITPDPSRAARIWEAVLTRIEATGAAVESERDGEAFFDASGIERLHGGLKGVLDTVTDRLGSSFLVAAAPTRLAALARAGEIGDGIEPVGMKSPDGTGTTASEDRVLPPEGLAAFLARQPLAILLDRLPGPVADVHRMLEAMRRLGLRTLGDLSSLPADAVADRFGPTGLAARDLALGLESPIRPRIPYEQVTEWLDLPDAATGIHLEGGLTILCDRLAGRLRTAGTSVRTLVIEARLLDGGSWSHQASPRQPTASSQTLHLLLFPILEQLPRPADRLGLRVLETAPHAADQLEVVHRPGEIRRRRLGEAARQVRAAVGESALMRILETEPESRLPERRMLLTPYSSE
jgi:protein ImuB